MFEFIFGLFVFLSILGACKAIFGDKIEPVDTTKANNAMRAMYAPLAILLMVIAGICRFVIVVIGIVFMPLFIVIAIKYTIWDAFLWCILLPMGLIIVSWVLLALCAGLLNAEERRSAEEEERERLYKAKQL